MIAYGWRRQKSWTKVWGTVGVASDGRTPRYPSHSRVHHPNHRSACYHSRICGGRSVYTAVFHRTTDHRLTGIVNRWVHSNQKNQFFGKKIKPTQEQLERKATLTWLGQKKQWYDILEMFVREGKKYGWLDLVSTLDHLAKAVPSFSQDHDDPNHPVLCEILTIIANRLENKSMPIDVRSYADIVHSIGQLRACTLHDEAALSIVNRLSSRAFAKEFLNGAQPLDVANVAHGLATLPRPDLMEGLVSYMVEQDRQALFRAKFNTPKHAVTVLWACATLRLPAPDLFEMMEERGHWLLTEADPQDVARVTWACATLGNAAPSLFAFIDHIAYELVANGKPSDVATTAWACATLGHAASDLFAAMDFHRADWLFVTKHTGVRTVNGIPPPQAIADTAWACATRGYAAPILFRVINRHIETSMLVDPGTTPYHITVTAWACAKLGHDSPVLCETMERRAEWLVDHGTPQDVARAVWACATLGHDAPTLFAAINDDRRSDWLLTHGPPSAIAQTAWACATLGHPTPALFAAIDRHCAVSSTSIPLVAHGTLQDLADTTWACAKLGHASPALFAAIAAQRWEGLITETAVNDADYNGDDDDDDDEDTIKQAVQRIRGAFQTMGQPLPY